MIKRPFKNISSWATPKLDLKGCVLYLPLWRPSSDMTGTTIYDYIARNACTVTNAIWGRQGRTFDGSNDYINCGSATSIDDIFDGGGTLIAWINPASDGEGDNGRIISKYGTSVQSWVSAIMGEASGKVKLELYFAFSTTGGQWQTTATQVPINAFTFIAITYNADDVANNPIFYVNSTAFTVGAGITEVSTPVGTRRSDAAHSLFIGDLHAEATNCFDGKIGEVWAYKGLILSARELESIRRVTRWRFT